jgi:hypothetical protein
MPMWTRIGLGVVVAGLTAYGAVAMLGGGEEQTDLATPTIAETTTTASGECNILGSWTLDGPAFAADVSAWMGADTEHLGGTYMMEFSGDGGFVSQRSAWTLRHDFPEGAIVTETTSREEGTWETDGPMITLSAPGDPAAAVMVWVELDGDLTPLPEGSAPMAAPGLSGTGTYTCPTADRMEIAVSYAEGPLTATLHRSG